VNSPRAITLSCWAALAIAILGGCATRPGATWWNPTTWFSGSEGRAVARLEARTDRAEAALLKEAQRTAHETSLALVTAPESRAVDVARDSASATVVALDQLAGPLTAGDVERLRAQVAGLLSEVATTRAAAEAERRLRRDELAEASAAIDRLRLDLRSAQADLQTAFTRENVLANQFRNARLALYATAAATALAIAGIAYLKVAYGGIPQAIGRGLTELRLRNPQAGDAATQIFDAYLNRREQRRIANAT
jgi:hypothetical protein